jgi:hypothetical protein
MHKLLLLAMGGGLLWAAADSPRLEITLERQDGERWVAVPPGLVLSKGDRVRFRLVSNFDGYLYAMNQGSSGSFEILFPREDTGSTNRILKSKEYLVPTTEAQSWFRIDGPPGFDVVHWIVSPAAFAAGSLPRPAKPAGPLLPKCDDVLMRAKGQCIDSTAGPRAAAPEKLPENLKKLNATSRELTIINDKNASVVTSAKPLSGPSVYLFRIAHN